jgi:multidrug resistance efflux pump
LEAQVTSPERLRRRQRIEGSLLLALGIFTILVSIYFRGQDAAQRECINTYIAANSDTSAVRSKLVERESQATRRLLLRGTSVESREEFQKVRAQYVRAIAAIDKARRENPVRPFPEGICD